MADTKIHAPLMDLVVSLSETMELISTDLSNHQLETVYVALKMGREMGLGGKDIQDLAVASLLHDVGLMTIREAGQAVRFDSNAIFPHSEIGYLLLGRYEPFSRAAEIVRRHHMFWRDRDARENGRTGAVRLAGIVHLADRISVLTRQRAADNGNVSALQSVIERESGRMFDPEAVDAFLSLAGRGELRFPLQELYVRDILASCADCGLSINSMEELREFSLLCSHLIDFRSAFTATHSRGVGAVARELSLLCGFDPHEADMIEAAGFLHDLGKLAVPAEILEKPAPLTASEFEVIRSHPYHVNRILEPHRSLGNIAAWASYHHETPDGEGYPFSLGERQLDLGCRVMTIADIYTALTEDRPYRKGIGAAEALEMVGAMFRDNVRDRHIARTLVRNFDSLDATRVAAQREARREYDEFRARFSENFRN